MEKLNKVKEKLKSFQNSWLDINSVQYSDNGEIQVYTYQNCIIADPNTIHSKREIQSKPYVRKLQTKKEIFGVYYFPIPIPKRDDLETKFYNSPKLNVKFKSRFINLLESYNKKNIILRPCIQLPYEEWLTAEWIARPYNKKTGFKDDEIDTLCKNLAKDQQPYQEINRISLNYNTLLILQNAKENGNKSLFYYLKKGTTAFYTDCIINYILEHSNLLDPEYFSFQNAPKEVRIPARELFKLYPHSHFNFVAPEGVIISNTTRPKTKRTSKNDIISFTFSDEYLQKFREIIKKSDTKTENTSFIKIPVFFVLEALQNKNFSSNGFKFLLWFLTFYRIKSPKIFHTVKTILQETGADLNHGYKKPIETLNKYFDYLFSLNVLSNVPTKLKFTTKDMNNRPEYNGALIQLSKPKKPKTKTD